MEVRDKSGRQLPTDDRAGRASGAWTRSQPPPSFLVSRPSSSRAVVVLGDALGCDFWSRFRAPVQCKLLAFPPTSPEYIVSLELDELVAAPGAFPETRAMFSTMRTMSFQNISASRVRRADLTRCQLRRPKPSLTGNFLPPSTARVIRASLPRAPYLTPLSSLNLPATPDFSTAPGVNSRQVRLPSHV